MHAGANANAKTIAAAALPNPSTKQALHDLGNDDDDDDDDDDNDDELPHATPWREV